MTSMEARSLGELSNVCVCACVRVCVCVRACVSVCLYAVL